MLIVPLKTFNFLPNVSSRNVLWLFVFAISLNDSSRMMVKHAIIILEKKNGVTFETASHSHRASANCVWFKTEYIVCIDELLWLNFWLWKVNVMWQLVCSSYHDPIQSMHCALQRCGYKQNFWKTAMPFWPWSFVKLSKQEYVQHSPAIHTRLKIIEKYVFCHVNFEPWCNIFRESFDTEWNSA